MHRVLIGCRRLSRAQSVAADLAPNLAGAMAILIADYYSLDQPPRIPDPSSCSCAVAPRAVSSHASHAPHALTGSGYQSLARHDPCADSSLASHAPHALTRGLPITPPTAVEPFSKIPWHLSSAAGQV